MTAAWKLGSLSPGKECCVVRQFASYGNVHAHVERTKFEQCLLHVNLQQRIAVIVIASLVGKKSAILRPCLCVVEKEMGKVSAALTFLNISGLSLPFKALLVRGFIQWLYSRRDIVGQFISPSAVARPNK